MSNKLSVKKGRESTSQLREFYDALEYDKIDQKEILSKIKALADAKEITDANNISLRFRETAFVMKRNTALFNAVFGHVDVTTAMIEYLNNCGKKLEHNVNIDEDYYTDDAIPILIMYMLFNLSTPLYEDVRYFLQKMLMFTNIPRKWSTRNKPEFEVILLADADLHAVMSYLTGMYGTSIYYPPPTKILVQEPIKEKFLYYVEKYKTQHTDCNKLSDVDIKVFRSKQELFTPKKSCFVDCTSIWSEDVTTAKSLATSLNRDCIFINVYYEFYSGAVLLPIKKILDRSLEDTVRTRFECDCDINTCTKQNADGPVSNLFYNGLWQKPVENRYWVHNDSLWAQAEWNDIVRCVLSASKGFKIWSSTSIDSRMQILLKFAHSLECTGNITMANIILKWIKFPYLYESVIGHSKSDKAGRVEVTKLREGRNIIIIKEETEIALFDRVIQTLIAGNSVIVICDASSCSFAPYCDKMSASMPPGVVNLLSHKNIHHLELYLCGTDYATYKKQFFSSDNIKQTYINLTVPKHILLYL